MLKISAVYLMWNPEICQDIPNQTQDNLVLSKGEIDKKAGVVIWVHFFYLF